MCRHRPLRARRDPKPENSASDLIGGGSNASSRERTSTAEMAIVGSCRGFFVPARRAIGTRRASRRGLRSPSVGRGPGCCRLARSRPRLSSHRAIGLKLAGSPLIHETYNPYIQGWLTYYGNFYRTKLRPTFNPSIAATDGRDRRPQSARVLRLRRPWRWRRRPWRWAAEGGGRHMCGSGGCACGAHFGRSGCGSCGCGAACGLEAAAAAPPQPVDSHSASLRMSRSDLIRGLVQPNARKAQAE